MNSLNWVITSQAQRIYHILSACALYAAHAANASAAEVNVNLDADELCFV